MHALTLQPPTHSPPPPSGDDDLEDEDGSDEDEDGSDEDEEDEGLSWEELEEEARRWVPGLSRFGLLCCVFGGAPACYCGSTVSSLDTVPIQNQPTQSCRIQTP
jgi:hypothetical protein